MVGHWKNVPIRQRTNILHRLNGTFWLGYQVQRPIGIRKKIYSKVSNKRTVFNNRTGGDIILQKV